MSNKRGDKPEFPASDDHDEADLLMSLWQAEASTFTPLPVSSKTKAALQELLRSHGVTHMPAIDSLEVYDAPEAPPVTVQPAPGRVALFQLMGAMRDGVALAARGVRDFLQAMNAPQPALAGSALRLAPSQLDAESALASSSSGNGPALGWHIDALSYRSSNRQITLVIRTHLVSSEPIHVAVLGWSSAAIALLSRAEPDTPAWVPRPQEVVRLWEGDLPGDQDTHRIAFKLPEECVWDETFNGERTLLVDDGAGALVANLKLGTEE